MTVEGEMTDALLWLAYDLSRCLLVAWLGALAIDGLAAERRARG
jgi:hypothetical protein